MMRATGSSLPHRKQQIWVCVIAALFVGDFVLCGYLPSQERLSSLQQTKAQQQQTLKMAAAQSAELPGLQRRLHEMQTAAERFELRVPPDRALGTFLQQIAGIMEGCGLTDQVVLPGMEWTADDLNCVPVHVACKGTVTSIFDFFRRLQALDRLVRLEKISLENHRDWTGQISLQIEAVIFEQSAKHRKTKESAEEQPGGGANHGA